MQGPEDRGSVFHLLPFPASSDYVHESGCQEEVSALIEHSRCPMEPTLGSSMGSSVAVTRAAHNYSQDVFLSIRSQENVRKSLVQWAECLLHSVCSGVQVSSTYTQTTGCGTVRLRPALGWKEYIPGAW